MASIFALGIGPAALMAASVAMAADSASPAASLDVTVTGFRNARGVARIVLCPADAAFPECGARGIPASARIESGAAHVRFDGVAPGRYAVAAFHDDNESGRLRKMLGIPLSGFGFSRNPPLRPRAPKFEECAITVSGAATAAVALRYLF